MKSPILLTGCTGYVGGRLRRVLEERGHALRCMARQPERLAEMASDTTEVIGGDVLKPESLEQVFEGVETAFYLIHSMGSNQDFEQHDREGAENFARAAGQAGVKRIVYLGGLAHGEGLSPHLRSRHEVGEVLKSSGATVVELRASIVLGSGSLSFEMIRSLVERLPIMITPRWVEVKAQPIAIDDLLDYLVHAVDVPLDDSKVFEVGGADQVSYGDLMREYARQRGLRRWMIRVPILTPRLSSLWLGLVTPIYARVGRKLIASIKNASVVQDSSALKAFPVQPRNMDQAVEAAIHNEEREIAESSWFDAFSSGGESRGWAGVHFRNRLVDIRERTVNASAQDAFTPIRRIGGANGWFGYDWLWRLRGFLDLLVGGVGVRRGRRSQETLRVGDALDFWRVEAYEPDRLLRLRAEMKLPGRAWLEFEVEPSEGGQVKIRQTALYDPVGLTGLAYWYMVCPLHVFVFASMLDGIVSGALSEGEAGRIGGAGTATPASSESTI
ncbi:MAG: SDR family oxidoreductase [Planctomycetota bacterium]|nr:SDR family oxidoreductase [Planctomycetota bacterium]